MQSSLTPRLVVLTGAGISAESGIATFRDPQNGFWQHFRPEDVATPEGFAAHPDTVYEFYNIRRAQLADVKPNAAHIALAKLQQAMGDKLLIVTQNVDDLHERAGASVLHMHGELKRALCQHCGESFVWESDFTAADACERCHKSGGLRPDVVWFGEMPYQMMKIDIALYNCERFVAIGTSGAVYPAAGFVESARANGASTLEINLEPSDVSALFDGHRLGPASEQVPLWVDETLASL